MVRVEATIANVRQFINEKIPTGETETDTGFTDEEIRSLIQSTSNAYAAAALGWRLKAGKASAGELKKYTIGQETYERSTGSDFASYCLEMAKMYDEMANKQDDLNASRVFTLKRPDTI